MEASQSISTGGQKWICREHSNTPCEFICLIGDAKDRFKCFKCLQIDPSLLSNVVSMSDVLLANDDEILKDYPPLKDHNLSEKLRNSSFQQSFEEIDNYFNKLREDIEKEVRAAQQRVKNIFIKQEQANTQLLEGYLRIAEIEKLKKLIVSEKQEAEKDLDNFIKQKWNKAEVNRKVMFNLMCEYETGKELSFDEPNSIAQKIIENLQSINFSKQPFLSSFNINLIKSTYDASNSMEITKINSNSYQIKKGTSSGITGQVFLDPILNPSLKYIFHIELNQKPGNINNCFQFGIVKDQVKDCGYANQQHMCYCEQKTFKGITKIIKGNSMPSEKQPLLKRSFEVRIHLDQKLLKVASFPDYSSIVELDDPNKIDPQVPYRFFFSMVCPGDMIKITNFRTCKFFQ